MSKLGSVPLVHNLANIDTVFAVLLKYSFLKSFW